MVDAALERFTDDHYTPSARLARLKQTPVDYRHHWAALADLGVLGTALPEALGGLGGCAVDVAHTVRTLSRALLLEPLVESAVVAGTLLAAAVGNPQQQAQVDALLDGSTITVLLGGRPGTDAGIRCAMRPDSSYLLSGSLPVVPFAQQANQWLVAAQDSASADTLIFLLAPDATAWGGGSYRLIDGHPACDIRWHDLAVPASALWLRGDAARVALARAGLLAAAAYGAEAAGILAQLVSTTGAYLTTRVQFGVTLSNFQALQHRYADMHMEALECSALTRAFAAAIDAADAAAVAQLHAAVAVAVARAPAHVGQEAIQMHGGMGLTEELIVSHYNARLLVLASQVAAWTPAATDAVAAQHADCIEAPNRSDQTDGSFDETAFRAEVAAFVHSHLSPDTRRKVMQGLYLEKHDYIQWQKALFERGWFGAAWPVSAGGKGWTIQQEHAFLQECAIHAAPMIIPYGLNMVGPVLFQFGNESQKQQHLPGILASDVWWCQGYSEPNAGSDLASLSTKAVREGDHYVVNGSKMWTTEAHFADWMHCLVRTERTSRKQEGISFLLIDMQTPGLTVEPIVTLDGVHHTNQTFFDNVRVPVENLVGMEGQGWKIAKFLLARERTFIADTGNKLRMLEQIKATVARYRGLLSASTRAIQDQRLAEIEASLTGLVELERAYVREWMAGQDDGIGASVLKVRGSELLQRMSIFWRDAMGPYGACYDPEDRKTGIGLGSELPWVQAAAVNYDYLYGRCWSVFGGSNEVQRNIIAQTLLRG